MKKYYLERNTDFGKDDLQIEKYFPVSKSDDELFEKLSKNKKYITRVEKEIIELYKNYKKDYNENWDLLNMKLFLALSQKKAFNFYEVVESFQTKDSKYKNWLNNYKKSILFLCFSEQNSLYEYSDIQK